MNSSSNPANENVAYGHLLALSSKLKRADQVNLVRALAGQLGMIAMFPAQIQVGSAASVAKATKSNKQKGPAKQAASNPLSGSPEKRAFDIAKKAVAKATKDCGGQKLPQSSSLILALEEAKDKYFRALSIAKGKNTEDANASSDEEEAPARKPVASTSFPAPKAPGKKSPNRK